MSYILDGRKYNAINRIVLAVVEKYITENPAVTYENLKKIFPDELQGSTGVIKNKIEYDTFVARTTTGATRFFRNNILKIKDDDIYVCTQWGGDLQDGRKGNKNTFFEYVKNTLKYDLIDNTSQNEQNNYQELSDTVNEDIIMHNIPLNQILYGPPGTGKTYKTINKAVEIVDNEFYQLHKEETPENRKALKEKFEEYKKAGQIEFVTFHQSYGYEEFVEGIKAETTKEENVKYEVTAGIFKKLCEKAQGNKVFSLGQFIGKYEVVGLTNELLKLKRESGSIIPIPMYLLNEVLELVLNQTISIDDLNNKTAIDKMSTSAEKFIINGYPNVFRDLAQYYVDNQTHSKINQKHILIIDEINRGNISKIFGELITLIEPSKRIGEEEEIRVRLPYSGEDGEPFGVPSNLYIVGTMNTADRSIAQIDTALRRRFVFEEMMPKPELLRDVVIEDSDINIEKTLEAINERIEYISDREHTIGHSYFLPLLETSTKEKLDEIFKVNIIPLLAEYFYGDWGDIEFVLNNNFIQEKTEKKYIINTERQLNRVYKVNDTFETSEYVKIYNGDSE